MRKKKYEENKRVSSKKKMECDPNCAWLAFGGGLACILRHTIAIKTATLVVDRTAELVDRRVTG